MNKRRITAVILALLVVGCGITVWRISVTEPEWPEMLSSGEGKPRYNWEVKPDFGWRTGNHVPVSLYFETGPDSNILADQLSCTGDFRIVKSKLTVSEQSEKKLYQLEVVVQTFTYKPQWNANFTIAYSEPGGKVEKLALMPVTVSSSRTFDDSKAKHPKDPDNVDSFADSKLASTAVLLAVGFIGVLLSMSRLVRKSNLVEKIASIAKENEPTGISGLLIMWERVAGQEQGQDLSAYRTFAEAVRKEFDIPSLTVTELAASDRENKALLVSILGVCEKVLWTGKILDDTDITLVRTALQELDVTA